MKDYGVTLFQVLSGNGDIKLQPNIFVSEYINNNGTLHMDTSGYNPGIIAHSFKFYIPFSKNDILITDYKNSRYIVYPTYKILVIDSPIRTNFTNATVSGVYSMDCSIYEEVLLDENLNEVSANNADDAVVKRCKPKSFELTPSMRDFFDALNKNEITIQ